MGNFGLEYFKHDIGITFVLNGCILEIGCQKVVFETKEKLLAELTRYLENPGVVEKEYMAKVK